MANVSSELESDGIMMNSKLKSPNHGAESNTMDSFQDGGQQHMNLDRSRNDFLPNLDGHHLNSDMNNFPQGTADPGLSNDSFGKMNDTMSRSQAPSYNSNFNRGHYTMADQHGGLPGTGSEGGDFPQENNQFSQFAQQNMRQAFPQTSRSGPLPGRPGNVGSNMGMMPSNYNSGQQRHPGTGGPGGVPQQGGPTPTLNQLLQNANSTQRYTAGGYGEYVIGQQKGGTPDMANNPSFNNPQGWPGPRGGPAMNPYQQTQHMTGNQAFRNQVGMYDPSQRRPGMAPGYQQQGQGPGPGHPGQQYHGPQQQQFSPNSSSPRGYPHMQGQQGRPGMPAMPFGQQMPPQYGQQEGQGSYGPQGQHFIGQPNQLNQQSQPGQQGPPGHVGNMMGQGSQQQQPQQQPPQPSQQSSQNAGQTPPQQPPQPTPTSQSSGPQQQQQLPQQSSQMQHQNQHQQPAQQQQQQQPPQQPTQQQQGPPQSASQDSVSNNSTDENGGDVGSGANSRATPTSQAPQHPAVTALRPTPSPVGSAGSRSNTPASVTGNQAGSPMPPRPPSAQVDGQNRIQSPMATQSYPQQMMPPTMGHAGGPGQMGFASNKMHPSMMGGPMGQFPQQNSQYPNQPQGQFGRSQGMPGYGGQPNSFPPNAPNQMYPGGGGGMQGMGRSMPNASYPSGYPLQASNMNSQYGQYNNTGTPPGMPPNQSVPTSGMPPNQSIPSSGMPPNQSVPSSGMPPNQSVPSSGMPPNQSVPSSGMPPNQSVPSSGMPPNQSVPNAGMPPNQNLPNSGMPNAGMPNNTGIPSASMQHTPSPMNSMANQMNNMGMSPAVLAASSDLQSPGPKGAQAAAQAAMLAAANSANRAQMMRQHGGTGGSGTGGGGTGGGGGGAATSPPAQPQTSPLPQLSPPQAQPQHGPSTQGGPQPPGPQQQQPPQPQQPPPQPQHPQHPQQQGSAPSRAMFGQYMTGPGGGPQQQPPGPHGPPPGGHYGPVGQMHGQPASQMPAHMDGMGPGVVGQGHGNGPVHLGFGGTLGNMPISSQSMANQDMMGGPGGPMGQPGMPGHNSMPGMPTMGAGMGPHGPHGGQMMLSSSSGLPMPGSMHPNMGPPGLHSSSMANNRSATPQMSQAGPVMSNSSSDRDGKSPVSDSEKTTLSGSGNNTNTTVTQSITSPVTNATENTPSNTPPTVTASVPGSSKVAPPVMPPPPPPRESGTDSQGENSNDEPPEKRMKTENASHPPTPASVAPSPSASMSSVHDEFENISSPSWPGTPKPGNEGGNKLYDMGDEPERRMFLDKLFAYMDDKGSPITAVPTISKQPIDLYKLYVLVKEKGGIVEVTKQKKWRDICSAINIGSSGSAGFTLRKNYIKYLLSFECKFEHGGIDPAPIVAQLESMSDKKSKNRANQSPAGGQGHMDFRPGQQGFDGFPPQQQPPPGMMPNQNMMPNSGMQPGYSGEGMMNNAGMPPNTSVVPNNSMMPNASMPNSMMPNSGSQHPQMIPNRNMMPNNSGDTVSVTDPFADNAPNMGNSQFPRPSMSTQLPPYSSTTGAMPPQQNSSMSGNAGFPGYSRPPGMAANMPPSGGYPQGMTPSGQYPAEGMNRQLPSQSEQYPNDPYRRGMAPGLDGFPSRGMQQGQEGFPNQYSGTRIMSQSGGQYNFNDSSQQGPSNTMMGGSQGMRPASQPGMAPTPSGDQMISGRYSGQSMPQRPHTPQEQFGPQGMPTPPPPQSGASPAPSQPYPAQRQYGTPGGDQYPGYPQQGQAMYPGQKPTPNMPGYQQKRYDSYNMPPGYTASQSNSGPYGESGSYPGSTSYGDGGSYSESGCAYGDRSQYHTYSSGPSLASSRRPMPSPDSMHSAQGGNRDQQWSRFPTQGGASYHQAGSPMPGQMPQNSANVPPFVMYNRPMNRASPQRPDKYGSPPKIQKPSGPQGAFPPKKEIVFPPDSIEAVQPVLTKRRRIIQKDIGATDPWRLMMALKSGLLAESTWALDTLSILLFDDTTISYFNLQHLPGLLNVLLDHFRRCLIKLFGDNFDDLEIKTEGDLKRLRCKEDSCSSDDDVTGVKGLDISPPNSENIDQPNNFTLVTRHGMAVKIEKDSKDANVLFDEKVWDVHTHYESSAKDWVLGCADRTDHIHTHFADTDVLEFYKKQFFGRNRKHIPLKKESVQKEECAENGGCVNGEVTEESEENTDQNGRESVKNETNDNSNACSSSSSSSSTTELDTTNPVINNTHSSETLSSYSNKSSSTSSGATDNANSSSSCTDYLTSVQIKTEPPDPIEVDESSKPPTESGKESEAHNSNKDACSDETAGDGEASSNSTLYTASVPSTDGDSDKSSSGVPPKCEVKEEEASSEKAACVKEETDKPTQSPDTRSENDKEPSEEPTPDELGRERAHQKHIEERRANDIAHKVVEQLRQKWEHGDEDKEVYQHDQPPLCLMTDTQDNLVRRCVCISNIFRSLSFVPGNDLKMSENCGLMRVLGRLLLLQHWHPKRVREQHRFDREDLDGSEDCVDDVSDEWWWATLDELRENTLVIYANIAGKLSLSRYPEGVCLPILEGLLHWAVCSSACAQDPLPTISSSSVLSPQRLVLEALCKLCIQEQNVDLLLATPPFSRIVQLLTTLIQLLANRKEQVMREFAIVLLSSLVAGDQCAARAVALIHPAIPLLVDFLETSEHQALQIANSHGVDMLRENPEMMGTSLGMLRRAANTLLHLAEVPENTSLFVHQQQRLLQLVMSQILDQNVASILADVLYHCSQVS